MNKITVLLLALVCQSVYATSEKLELLKFSSQSVDVQTGTKNPDNSATFRGISILRGDQIFSIAAFESQYRAVCKMLGYDDVLEGKDLNYFEINENGLWKVVRLNDDGTFKDIDTSSRRIKKVTCFNTSELKPQVEFSKVVNPDRSVKISKIAYMLGDQTYRIAAEKATPTSVCQLAGFQFAMPENAFHQYESSYDKMWSAVIIRADDLYFKTTSTLKIVSHVTCMNELNPDLIILIQGERYRREIP